MLQVKGQSEIFSGQDFDRGRRSTYSVSRHDTLLFLYKIKRRAAQFPIGGGGCILSMLSDYLADYRWSSVIRGALQQQMELLNTESYYIFD